MKPRAPHAAAAGCRRLEHGSALLMAVFVLALVSLTGVSLMFLGANEQTMSRRSTHLKQAFYLAEAGEEAARTRLFLLNGNDDFSDELATFAGANGVFDLDLASLAPIYDSTGALTGVTGVGDDVPIQPVRQLGGGWILAFVTNDPAEGITTTTDNNDLVMITAIGAGPNRSAEVVQAIVLRWEIVPELPPATITMLGQEVVFAGGTSDAHDYSGDDCPGGVPNFSVPVVGLIDEGAEADAEQGIHYGDIDSATGDYDGPDYESGTWSREETFVNLNDPSDPILQANGFGGLGDMYTDCQATKEFIETMRKIADVECIRTPHNGISAKTLCKAPSPPYSNVIFVDGDYELNPPGGSGTLVVTGQLRYDGRASWKGLIYAFGSGEFVHKGAGNGLISGAILVADVAGPDGIYGTDDDCTGGDENNFGVASFDMSGGGNADTRYCSSDIYAGRPNPPLRITSFRQD